MVKSIVSGKNSKTFRDTEANFYNSKNSLKMSAAARRAGIFFVFIFFSFCSFAGAEISINGLSGTLLVPGLDILPNGGARAGIHMIGKSAFNEASFKAAFAFSDDSEVAVVKRFTFDGRNDQTDPVFSGKYKVRENMAVAAVLDNNDDYRSSVMLLSGTQGNRVVLGVGTNIAMNENEKKASFGRYAGRGVNAEIDPMFFVMGARMNLNDDTLLTVDYAGNDFVVGLRHKFDENVSLDFGLYTPDRVYDYNRYLVGANFGF